MTKVLIAGDWHGNLRWASKVVEIAERNYVSIIVQLGDFGLWPGGHDYLGKLNKAAKSKGITIFVVLGNHEDYDQYDALVTAQQPDKFNFVKVRSNIYLTKVGFLQVEDKRFGFVGGAVSIDRQWRVAGKSWWPQEQLTVAEANLAGSMGKVDYLFTHDCPVEHPFGTMLHMVDDPESHIHRQIVTEVAKRLDPVLWFHGHMHTAAKYNYRNSIVYSLDCDDRSMRDNIKILDIETGEVSEAYRT